MATLHSFLKKQIKIWHIFIWGTNILHKHCFYVLIFFSIFVQDWQTKSVLFILQCSVQCSVVLYSVVQCSEGHLLSVISSNGFFPIIISITGRPTNNFHWYPHHTLPILYTNFSVHYTVYSIFTKHYFVNTFLHIVPKYLV